jgi:hypothetical protein
MASSETLSPYAGHVHASEPSIDDPRLADFPRALTGDERASLFVLLPEGAFVGVDEYRAQVDYATAVAPCSCPCPTIQIEVDRSKARPSPYRRKPLPVEYVYEVPDDPEHETYWLMAWADDGYLSGLEIAWLNEPPGEFPPPEVWTDVGEARTPGDAGV